MELPHLGDHCSKEGCNQLDYLPTKCNLCDKTFCHVHHRYSDHSCPESYKLDVRIPICPLCDQPVPSKSGVAPDLAVSEHIENNCQSKKSKKIYITKCSASGCRVKEMVAVTCSTCQKNFCLTHRHTVDHNCQGPVSSKRNADKSGPSSKFNFSNMFNAVRSSTVDRNTMVHNRSPPNMSAYQSGLSEEEALQRACAESLDKGQPRGHMTTLQEKEDEELARAMALSLQTSASSSQSKNKSDCSVS